MQHNWEKGVAYVAKEGTTSREVNRHIDMLIGINVEMSRIYLLRSKAGVTTHMNFRDIPLMTADFGVAALNNQLQSPISSSLLEILCLFFLYGCHLVYGKAITTWLSFIAMWSS